MIAYNQKTGKQEKLVPTDKQDAGKVWGRYTVIGRHSEDILCQVGSKFETCRPYLVSEDTTDGITVKNWVIIPNGVLTDRPSEEEMRKAIAAENAAYEKEQIEREARKQAYANKCAAAKAEYEAKLAACQKCLELKRELQARRMSYPSGAIEIDYNRNGPVAAWDEDVREYYIKGDLQTALAWIDEQSQRLIANGNCGVPQL